MLLFVGGGAVAALARALADEYNLGGHLAFDDPYQVLPMVPALVQSGLKGVVLTPPSVPILRETLMPLTERVRVIIVGEGDGSLPHATVVPAAVDLHELATRLGLRTARQTLFVAVTCLKGGVGKTTASVQLGATIVQMGHRVLLADMDHSDGDVSIGTAIQEPVGLVSLHTLLARGYPLSMSDVEARVVAWHGLDLLPARLLVDPGDGQDAGERERIWHALTPQTAGRVLALLDGHWDIVLLDLPADYDAGTPYPAALVERAMQRQQAGQGVGCGWLVIAQNAPYEERGAVRTLAHLRDLPLHPLPPVGLIANRMGAGEALPPRLQAELLTWRREGLVVPEVLGYLPEARDLLTEAARQGKPLHQLLVGGPFSRSGEGKGWLQGLRAIGTHLEGWRTAQTPIPAAQKA